MASQWTDPNYLPTNFGHDVALFPTWSTDHGTAPSTSASRRRAADQWTGVRRRVIRQIVVLEVVGRLGDLTEDLDREIQVALAEGPRGVVCELSDEVDIDRVIGAVAGAGRHVRDWPGVPVAVACLDPMVREALRRHLLGSYLIVAESQLTALTAVLATPDLAARRLRLPPHPSTPRVTREFISTTLQDWGLGRLTPFASLVVNELVASSSSEAGSDIDVSVVWDRGAGRWDLGLLRMTVRDHAVTGHALTGHAVTGRAVTGRAVTGHALTSRRSTGHAPAPRSWGLQGRGRAVVAGISRAFGVLPAAYGGKTVWAVLEAPTPRPLTRSSHRTGPGNT